MCFYVAHKYGFLAADVVMNGIRHPIFDKDIRKALPFLSFKKAEEAIAKLSFGRHFAIVNTYFPLMREVDTDEELLAEVPSEDNHGEYETVGDGDIRAVPSEQHHGGVNHGG